MSISFLPFRRDYSVSYHDRISYRCLSNWECFPFSHPQPDTCSSTIHRCPPSLTPDSNSRPLLPHLWYIVHRYRATISSWKQPPDGHTPYVSRSALLRTIPRWIIKPWKRELSTLSLRKVKFGCYLFDAGRAISTQIIVI